MRAKQLKEPAHLLTGRRGEDWAADYLRGLRVKVLERNWRPPARLGRVSALELDIVAREGETLLFAEVKTRAYAPEDPFSPQDAFTPSKQARLRRAALWYIHLHDQWSSPCRFDLICVILYPDASRKLEHFKDVLSLQDAQRGRTPGCSHPPWQPW
ncbi:MAG: YraN family protein [Deltaproteobacteria bacterium]|jgi:putative endonuclease|nr:YraN family protein [Deltaproteobacteria bacterium]